MRDILILKECKKVYMPYLVSIIHIQKEWMTECHCKYCVELQITNITADKFAFWILPAIIR